MSSLRLWTLPWIFSVMGGVGCTSIPPVEEYAIAQASINAASSVEAARFSPGYWHKAEEAYRRGRASYTEGDYGIAREFFEEARWAAERAENSARVLRMRSGETL